MSKFSSPTIFIEGDDYEQWMRAVKMSRLINDVPKDLHAVSVRLSLTGRAKNATSEVPYGQITSANGMDKIFEKLEFICKVETGEPSNDISTLKFIREQMVLR